MTATAATTTWARAESFRATANYFERLQRTLFLSYIFHFPFSIHILRILPVLLSIQLLFCNTKCIHFFFARRAVDCVAFSPITRSTAIALVFGFAH